MDYILLIAGFLLLIAGADYFVKGASDIATALKVSPLLVGLTIVAVGTSLPELITSVTAALKKQGDIAIGNIVGSNIFNIFFVLGTASVISPLPVNSAIFFDTSLMVVLTILLLIFSRTHYKVGKLEGVILAIA